MENEPANGRPADPDSLQFVTHWVVTVYFQIHGTGVISLPADRTSWSEERERAFLHICCAYGIPQAVLVEGSLIGSAEIARIYADADKG